MTQKAASILQLEDVHRSYRQGAVTLEILKGIDLEIVPGELVALVGPSGAGKSTLLHLAGLLERGSTGEITVDGRSCSRLTDRERTRLRRERIGFVYQFHHLLPDFTALENVALPQLFAKMGPGAASRRGRELLERLGLGDRLRHRPGRLSGGEQQRVAIARALANRPKLILADEPTGNLDPETSNEVFDVFLDIVREESAGALIATHNLALAARMDRRLRLAEGRLVPFDRIVENATFG